jgi:hypothetical protein
MSFKHLNVVHFSHSSREAFHENLRTCGNLQWVISQTERGLLEAPWTEEDEERGKKILIWFDEKEFSPRSVNDTDPGPDVEVKVLYRGRNEGEP